MVSKHAKSVDLFLWINVLQTIMDLWLNLQEFIVRTTTLQLWEKNERPILTIKSPKNCIFPKGLTHAFGAKNVNFFLYLFSVKIRLVIVWLNDFVEKKETILSIKKQNFSKSKNSHFSKGFNPCFWSKNTNIFFI